MYATSDIPAGINLIVVPYEFGLNTDDMYKEFPSFKKLTDYISEENAFNIFLAHSRYSPNHLAALMLAPEVCINGIFFPEEMENLLTDQEYARVNGSRTRMLTAWNEYEKALKRGTIKDTKGLGKLTFEDFKWGSCIKRTRSFGTGSKFDGIEFALVPVADLLNHSEEPNVSWRFDASTYMWTYRTKKELLKEGELSIHYGTTYRNNLEQLVTYGFIIPENPAAIYVLKLKFDDVLKTKAAETLLGSSQLHIQLTRNGITQKELATLALLQLTDEEVANGGLDSLVRKEVSDTISQKVWEWLIQHCTQKLEQFTGTNEEDKGQIEELSRKLKGLNLGTEERVSKSAKMWLLIYRVETRNFYTEFKHYSQSKIHKTEL